MYSAVPDQKPVAVKHPAVEVHYGRYRRRKVRTGTACGPPQSTGLPPIELDTDLVWAETPPALCGNQNRHLHTEATVAVLDCLLDQL